MQINNKKTEASITNGIKEFGKGSIYSSKPFSLSERIRAIAVSALFMNLEFGRKIFRFSKGYPSYPSQSSIKNNLFSNI